MSIEIIKNNTEAFFEIKNLKKIIEYCDLYITHKKNKYLPAKKWNDAFHNQVILSKQNFQVNEFVTDQENNFISYDLYIGLDLNEILKITKTVMLVIGITEFNNINCYLNCLCFDKKIRSYYLNDNEWMKVSPLHLGYELLNELIINEDTITYNVINYEHQILIPLFNQKIVLARYPFNKFLFNEIPELNDIFEKSI